MIRSSFTLALIIALSACSTNQTQTNKQPTFTSDNRYAKSCGITNLNACMKASFEQAKIDKRNRERAEREAREKAEWDRIKNNPLNQNQITELQNNLNKLGYSSVSPTGYADYETQNAIRSLQSADNQPVTGQATNEVLVAVRRKVSRQENAAATAALIGIIGRAMLSGGGSSSSGSCPPGQTAYNKVDTRTGMSWEVCR